MRSMFVDSPYRHASKVHPFVAAPMRNQKPPQRPASARRPIPLKRSSRRLVDEGAAVMPAEKKREGPAKDRPARLQPLYIGNTNIDWRSIDTRRTRLSFNPLTRETKLVQIQVPPIKSKLPPSRPISHSQSTPRTIKQTQVTSHPIRHSHSTPQPTKHKQSNHPSTKLTPTKPTSLPQTSDQSDTQSEGDSDSTLDASEPMPKLDSKHELINQMNDWDTQTAHPTPETSPIVSNSPTLLDSESRHSKRGSWRNSLASISHLFKKHSKPTSVHPEGHLKSQKNWFSKLIHRQSSPVMTS